jgi:hypothetical protein
VILIGLSFGTVGDRGGWNPTSLLLGQQQQLITPRYDPGLSYRVDEGLFDTPHKRDNAVKWE